MNGLGWQDLIVLLLVGGAVAFLVRRRQRKAAPKPTLVTLGRAAKGPAGASCCRDG